MLLRKLEAAQNISVLPVPKGYKRRQWTFVWPRGAICIICFAKESRGKWTLLCSKLKLEHFTDSRLLGGFSRLLTTEALKYWK